MRSNASWADRMSPSRSSLDTAIASLHLLTCLRRQPGREQWFLEHKARAIADVVTLACDESDAEGQDALFALIKIIDLI